MNRLVQSLAAMCREHLLEEKRLVAPSLRAGHQWLDAVARAGTPVMNVRSTTLRGLALEIANPEMARRGLRLMPGKTGPIIMDRVLHRLRESSPGYLTRLRITPGLCKTVFSSITDLKLAGLGADDLSERSFEPPEKGREIAALLKAYDEELRRIALADYSDALEMAIGHCAERRKPFGDGVLLLFPEDADLTGRERVLVEAFPGDQVVRLPVDRPGVLTDSAAGAATNADLLRWVLEPSEAPAGPGDDGTVEIFHAVGEVNEVREVFRRCLRKGLPLDEVEVLHTDTNTYVPLFYEVAARLQPDFSGPEGLFVTFEEGIPTSYSRPGKALAAWVSWISKGFFQSDLVKMFHEGLLKPSGAKDGGPGHNRLGDLLGSVGIGFGRERYLPRLDDAIHVLDAQCGGTIAGLEDDDPPDEAALERIRTRRDEMIFLRRIVKELLDVAPNPDASVTEVLSAAAAFLEGNVTSVTELDNYAARALLDEIRETAAAYEGVEVIGSPDSWERPAELPLSVRVMGSAPRPGKMHVAALHSGGHSLRRHTFIAGLDDGRFPGAGLQDPVVLDSEREGLSRAIPTVSGRMGKRLMDFARLLSRLRGAVTLSWSCRDLIDDREMFPAQVVLNAFRIVSGVRNADLTALNERLPTAVAFAPEDPAGSLDMTEWWLSRLCHGHTIEEGSALFEQRFPHRGRGGEATARRAGPEFTEYDGRISEPPRDLDPTSPLGRVVSASMLETIGRCPLAYFFRYVLDIRPAEEAGANPDEWLDPLLFGNLLHEVLYVFVSEKAKEAWPPVYAEDERRLREIAMEIASRYREDIPPPSEEAFLTQLRKLRQAVETFARIEERTGDRRPVYLEASLGLPAFGNGTAADTAEPVVFELPDGRSIRVRGRLDRIDVKTGGAPHRFVICDYKSGSAWKYESGDPFRHGRVVQHALYGTIAEKRLREAVSEDARVDEFLYFFPGLRDHGLQIAFRPDDLAEGPSVIGKLCTIAASGSFLATNDSDADCGICAYRKICGDVKAVAAASDGKILNLDNADLAAMRELRSGD